VTRPALLGALLAAAGCAGAPRRPPLMTAGLDAASVQGTWHVVATTFPMWTEGRRREPTFTYSGLRREGGRVRFDDTVGFVRDGERDAIEGVDTQHAGVPTHFTWRGRGWLCLFTSEWDVVALDPAGRWAALTFSSTIATPAGVDVIARDATLDPATLASVVAMLRGDPVAAPLLGGLVTLAPR
jgi:lipocalin